MIFQESRRIAAARSLIEALNRETALARVGGLAELADAAQAKRIAYEAFAKFCQDDPTPPAASSDADAMTELLTAARENAVVLEAVQSTLDDFMGRLRSLMRSAADPETYTLDGRGTRHVLAAQIDARA